MKKVIITLQSDQSIKKINKVMEKMLWDSEFSYEFEEADWKINDQSPDLTYNHLMEWDKNDLAEFILNNL